MYGLYYGLCVCALLSPVQAIFESDNLTTLNILKNYITADATATTLRIDISTDAPKDLASHFLQLVAPLLEYQIDLKQKSAVLGMSRLCLAHM